MRCSALEMLEHPSSKSATVALSFGDILADAKQRLINLLSIPDTHEVLFLQGGSRLQFSMIPMNLLPDGGSADYIVTGSWTKKGG